MQEHALLLDASAAIQLDAAHKLYCCHGFSSCAGGVVVTESVACPIAGHNYIGTEHILLGLLREGEGVAARVLETLGADPAKIRTQVRKGA